MTSPSPQPCVRRLGHTVQPRVRTYTIHAFGQTFYQTTVRAVTHAIVSRNRSPYSAVKRALVLGDRDVEVFEIVEGVASGPSPSTQET